MGRSAELSVSLLFLWTLGKLSKHLPKSRCLGFWTNSYYSDA
ncbi:hypothetical protein [Leptospira interrogans]|nr:hypothetical protein [Leptospira interrogans]